MGNLESHWDVVGGVDLAKLTIDQAYVYYSSNATGKESWIYSLNSECNRCDPQLEVKSSILGGQQIGQPISTKFQPELYAGFNNQGFNLSEPCTKDADFLEFGIYNCSVIDVGTSEQLSCHCTEVLEGKNIYWPILCAFGFFFGLAALWLLALYGFRKGNRAVTKWRQQRNSIKFDDNDITDIKMASLSPIESTEQINEAQSKAKQRIKSIDTFRGISICTMIFVNYGGGGYWFFNHAPWNGLTVADLVFPWFMWLMGVCIPMSTMSMYKRKGSKQRVFIKIFKRCLWLFLLGLAVSNINNIDVRVLRIFGVLQRFSITYFIVATLHLVFLNTGNNQTQQEPGMFSDIGKIVYEWVALAIIVTSHLIITFLLPVPGCPKGYLGPGGRHDGGQYFNCTGGAAGYIDRLVLGDPHVYQHPTSDEIFGGTVPYDPEGILGTFEATFTVFLGLQAGMILVTFKNWKPRVIRWLIWSLITGAVAATLCRATANDGWIPINKNLWSLSFVMVTSCFAYLLLSLLYVILDVLKWWNGAPFFYPGMNSIVLYVGHELATAVFPFQWYDSFNAPHIETHGYQTVLDLWVVVAWIVISFWLFSIKFFVAL